MSNDCWIMLFVIDISFITLIEPSPACQHCGRHRMSQFVTSMIFGYSYNVIKLWGMNSY